MGRAWRRRRAGAGMIWLNSENVRHLPTPFGGMNRPASAATGGDYSFDFYMETKHVFLAREPTRSAAGNMKPAVIPGRVEDANPESRDSGSGPSTIPE